jgi:hypothetical protein
MAGERLIQPETAGGHDGARLTRGWRLKELLTAGPHLSALGAKRKGGRRCWAGGEGRLGHLGRLRAHGKKRKGRSPWVGPRAEEKCWAGGEEKRGRGRGGRKGFPFF